jgi:peptidoglycan/xylan/chitin deacetylase (PgdA/CDA1 family)
MIALTFDDGPSQYTPRILDLLEQYGARATFCVVGTYVNARKDTVKRASELGCEVIGHSWDHRDLSKLSPEEIAKELGDTSAVIESATGVSPGMYRPPYGAINSTLKNVSGELGYALITWSVDPEDWKTRNADAVYSAFMGHVSDRAIVLSHDLYGTTADAYERIIPELLSMGYQLVTVSELMYYSGKTLEAGAVYYSGK